MNVTNIEKMYDRRNYTADRRAQSLLNQLADDFMCAIIGQVRGELEFENQSAWAVTARMDGARGVVLSPEMDRIGDAYLIAGTWSNLGFRVTIYRGRTAHQ